MDAVQPLKVRLEDIKLATNNFGDENFIAQGAFWKVYLGKLTLSGQHSTVAVKRLDHTWGQGRDYDNLMEIQMLSCYRHKNLISLLGFCEENGESIFVYEHAKHGSLDNYLSDSKLSWMQRLQISLGAALGFNYLHNDVGPQHKILHRDIKSSNILLNENWEAKISDFGLSKVGNIDSTFLVTNASGTLGYVDPQYFCTGLLTKESDVYSFGVVLFEILCGRPAFMDQYEDERQSLASLAPQYCEENRLADIIHPNFVNQVNVGSLNMFSMVAYECLRENRMERPTMAWVVEKLEKALELQGCSKVERFIKVGPWGSQSGGPGNQLSFELEKHDNLQKITIVHGDVINFLIFTSDDEGVLHTSIMAGGWVGADNVSEVIFDGDEEIIGISGTISTHDGCTILSSLSFDTTRGTHGPYGEATGTAFSVSWDKGSLAGLYGFAGNYIDGIGIYLKGFDEIIRVGTWGRPAGGRNTWYFHLERIII